MTIVWKGSPNFIKGRQGVKIDRIIIHWFGVGTLESANTRFQKAYNKVSAHYGISKGRVWQWVKETDVAFQAGNLSMNKRGIGIEHDATLNGHNLSEQDYQLSGQLVKEIAERYNIPLDRQHIIGHREIKATTCPGTINIDKIINIAKSLIKDSMILKEKGKPALYAVVGEVLIPFTNYPKFLKDFDPSKIIEVDSAQIAKFKISKDNQIT